MLYVQSDTPLCKYQSLGINAALGQPKSSLKEDKYSLTKNLLKGNFMQKITIYNLLNIFDSVFIVKREYDYIFTIFCPLNMQIMQFSTIFHIFCLSKLKLVPLNYQQIDIIHYQVYSKLLGYVLRHKKVPNIVKNGHFCLYFTKWPTGQI